MRNCPFSWDRPIVHIAPEDENKPVDVEGNVSPPHINDDSDNDLEVQLALSSDEGSKSDIETDTDSRPDREANYISANEDITRSRNTSPQREESSTDKQHRELTKKLEPASARLPARHKMPAVANFNFSKKLTACPKAATEQTKKPNKVAPDTFLTSTLLLFDNTQETPELSQNKETMNIQPMDEQSSAEEEEAMNTTTSMKRGHNMAGNTGTPPPSPDSKSKRSPNKKKRKKKGR